MKICEYENIRCPYCGETEKLVELARPKTEGPMHALRCRRCEGIFHIECQD